MQIFAVNNFTQIHKADLKQQPNLSITNIKNNDTIYFSGQKSVKKTDINYSTAVKVTNSFVSSTSGHRAIYGTPLFNRTAIELLSLGVADYSKEISKIKNKKPVVMVGGDTRKASKELLNIVADTLANRGVNVVLIKKPVPTPLHAYMAKKNNYDISVLLTASHNPWEYGGFNLVTSNGAIAPNDVTTQVAQKALMHAKRGSYVIDKSERGKITTKYPYDMYKNLIESYGIINWDNIKHSNIDIYYDGLRGTGVSVLPRLLKNHGIKVTNFVSTKQKGPEPNATNLTELSKKVASSKKELKIGLATDGDADRFGIIDETGKYITANEILLLLAYHLHKNKGKTGAIIRSQATSSLIDIYAKQNKLPVIQTPVGFKFIGEDIIELRKHGKDILIAGEESNGLTINGHIPEKDGIIAVSLILDLIATEKKPLSVILKDLKQSLRTEYRIKSINKVLSDERTKEKIMDNLKQRYIYAIHGSRKMGDFLINIDKTNKNLISMEEYKRGGDGIKLYFTDGSSILVRKSGTEPKIKAYIETKHKSKAEADENIEKLSNLLGNLLTIN